MPPCDRCRRLRMDCVKNLTSCAGCTKKHARCHWRDVSREELGELDHLMESAYSAPGASLGLLPINTLGNGYPHAGSEGLDDLDVSDDDDDDDSNPLEDLEALEEKEERETEAAAERLREDEEGLRQARELARQGWENNMRTHRQGDEPIAENGTEAMTEPVDGASSDETSASHTDVVEHNAMANGHVDSKPSLPSEPLESSQPNILPTASEKTSLDHKTISQSSPLLNLGSAGFCAVNDTTSAVS